MLKWVYEKSTCPSYWNFALFFIQATGKYRIQIALYLLFKLQITTNWIIQRCICYSIIVLLVLLNDLCETHVSTCLVILTYNDASNRVIETGCMIISIKKTVRCNGISLSAQCIGLCSCSSSFVPIKRHSVITFDIATMMTTSMFHFGIVMWK